jgi:hypothetical protein
VPLIAGSGLVIEPWPGPDTSGSVECNGPTVPLLLGILSDLIEEFVIALEPLG